MLYLFLKSLHIAAVLTFLGGLLANALLLPLIRGGVYAHGAQTVAARLRTWNTFVTTPGMLMVWALGLTLGLQGEWFSFGWLQAKLLFVLVLSALHGVQSGALRRLAAGADTNIGAMWFSAPLIIGLAIVISILVGIKPF